MTLNHPLAHGVRDLAIIADGNRRWATARGLPTIMGHIAGADTLKARIHDLIELGIEQLTVYSFSTENWHRPETEVRGLIGMLAKRIAQETPTLNDAGVRMRFIGRTNPAPAAMLNQIRRSEAQTATNQRLTIFIAFNYGGRAEIIDAARRFTGTTEFRSLLYAPDMHDTQLLIRAGGEQRLSNFLLWQAANAQLVFRDELWPDFSRAALLQSLAQHTDADQPPHTPQATIHHAQDSRTSAPADIVHS